MPQAPELVGIGNALVDVVAFSEENLGSLLDLPPNEAIHVGSERFADLLVSIPDPALSAGGGSASVAKIASLLGIRTAFVGRVGSRPNGDPDRFAEVFETEMREAGVDTVLLRGKEPTGACLTVRMPGGAFVSAASPGAALGLGPDDLPEDLIRTAKLLVLDGYILDRHELVVKALSLADNYGTAVALDVGSARIASAFGPFIASLAKTFPLILFMNEAETVAFSGSLSAATDLDEDDIFDLIRSLTESGPFPIIVVKRGPRGALVFAGGMRFDSPARAVAARDETGAGDTFAVGFLAAWIKDRPLTTCAALGNRIAREAVSVPGTRIDPARVARLAKAISR